MSPEQITARDGSLHRRFRQNINQEKTRLLNKIGAVITRGDSLGLGLLRALARKGVPTILLDHQPCIGRYSKFTKRFFKSPHPSETQNYIKFLVRLAESEGIRGWVIFPTSDEATYVLSRYKAILEDHFIIPTPGWEVIRNVYIKKETYKVAERIGISIPKLYEINNLEQLMKSKVKYPLVLKPSISHRFCGKTRIKAFRINSEEQLMRTYQLMSRIIDSSEILVQDFIPGGPRNLYSFCPFFKNGKVIAGVTGWRTRQRPMDFGFSSTYVELVDIPELRDISECFLASIGYYGIAEVEFMRDPRDRQYKLIEVNPRAWAWHTLPATAGVDLHYLLYQDLIGEEIKVPSSLKKVKWVRLTADIPTAFSEIIKGSLRINDYIGSMKGKKEDAVLSVTDPLPFLAEMLLTLYRKAKRSL